LEDFNESMHDAAADEAATEVCMNWLILC
jgi:hypothetical protein